MSHLSLYPSDIVEDIFPEGGEVEEISFEEAFSDPIAMPSTPVISDAVQPIVVEVADEPSATDDSLPHSSQERYSHQTSSSDAVDDRNSPQDFQMWGQVSFKFAEMLAKWRREELWRQVAPSWEAFVLQHVKLPQTFVNELCEIAERTEECSESESSVGGVGELEPFIPCSVHTAAQRIRQYLQTRPDYSELSPSHKHSLDASDYVEFELGDFRVYIWFEYIMPLDNQPHHFTRPWISNIDFQLCGEGYGEGLYSWLNISHTDIQLRQNASASTLAAWRSWAEALQQELIRSFIPFGMAVAIDQSHSGSGYRAS
ncbi:MAG: hypothetical protein AB4050_17290 [Synechococcus sp.]